MICDELQADALVWCVDELLVDALICCDELSVDALICCGGDELRLMDWSGVLMLLLVDALIIWCDELSVDALIRVRLEVTCVASCFWRLA